MFAIPRSHPDHEGMDEWTVGIFHPGNPSEELAGMVGLLASCLKFISTYALDHPNEQFHVGIGRVC